MINQWSEKAFPNDTENDKVYEFDGDSLKMRKYHTGYTRSHQH